MAGATAGSTRSRMTQLGLQWPGYRLTDPRQFAILLARVTDLFGMAAARTPWWAYTWPLLAWAVLLMTPFVKGGLIDAVAGVALVTTVFAAVYHAEVVALRTGEPFGTLVLAVAVTTIEVALIVSIMIGAPAEKAGLARDTVFAAVMIVCNGIVGLCLLWAPMKRRKFLRLLVARLTQCPGGFTRTAPHRSRKVSCR